MSHENFSLPCSSPSLQDFLFQGVAVSKGGVRPWSPPAGGPFRGSATKVMARGRACACVELDFDHMDDGGMYAWAVILAVVGLAAAFGIAAWWQRWKDARRKARE